MNKKSVKITLLMALAIVLAVFPAFENKFYLFEYFGENFSFLTWNTQLMVGHGELYGFEGSPFLTSILMFGAMIVLIAINIAVSVMENKSKENCVALGWISVALSLISIILLISSVKKIVDVFLPSMDEIMFGTYLAIVLALAVAVIAFIDAGSNKAPVIEKNTVKNDYENIDKIASLKELLDSGAITQEEFEEKKKQLLK